MATIVLISCVSKKLGRRAKARELYTSPLFKMGFRYAKSLNPDKIFILSAKYGLVDTETEIDPYEQTLNTMSNGQIMEWSEQVLQDLSAKCDLANDSFVFLAGENYRKYLVPHIKHYQIPMDKLSIGRQLQFLKGAVK